MFLIVVVNNTNTGLIFILSILQLTVMFSAVLPVLCNTGCSSLVQYAAQHQIKEIYTEDPHTSRQPSVPLVKKTEGRLYSA